MQINKLVLLFCLIFPPVLAFSGLPEGLRVSFEPVSAPQTDEEKRMIRAVQEVVINGHAIKSGYHVLARSGDNMGGHTFGMLTDHHGKPISETKTDRPEVSNYADFSSLLQINDKLFSISHFESRPAAMYLSELNQDAAGKLSMKSTRSIDFSDLGGLWAPCAGSVTPWQTHLGSEEYPPDARSVEAAEELEDLDQNDRGMGRYFGLDPHEMSLDDFRQVFHPYRYGYATEVAVSGDGSTEVQKHFAMGRFSHELAYVMPDRKTVYLSDDGTNVGLFMFIADTEGDLSAGRLFAMQWQQRSNEQGGAADLEWIDLGHADNAEVKSLIDQGITFSKMFATAKGKRSNGTCPTGFSPVNTTDGFECLKLRKGMALAASRLETRRYAALNGATTELRKEEGITYDSKRNRLYVAISSVERGMEDYAKNGKHSDKFDGGGPNHVRLPSNRCGTVYALELGSALGSAYVAHSMKGMLSGREDDNAGTPYAHENRCAIDGIANPDNLTMISGSDTLIIGEDSSSGHRNDVVWAYNVESGRLDRILTTPYGAETTSPYWYPDINGYAYLITVVQHPYGESDQHMLKHDSEAAAYIGYLGPFKVR